MDQKIAWWQSKTIWIGVAQAVVGILVGLGYMTEAEGTEATSWLQQILGAVVSGLGAASIWGRVVAKSEIKPEVLPPASGGSQLPPEMHA